MFLSAEEALKEFPFLSRVGLGKLRDVYVRQADRNLLWRYAQDSHVLFDDYFVEFLDIFVLDAEGKTLAQVGPRRIWNYLAFFHLDWFLSDETVGDAFLKLRRKGKLQKAAFVLVYDRKSCELILFKPPEGVSVARLYELDLEAIALSRRHHA